MSAKSSPPITDKDAETSPDPPIVDAETAGSLLATYLTVVLSLVCIGTFVLFLSQRSRRTSWKQYGVVEAKLPLFFGFGEDIRSKFSKLLNEYGDIVGFGGGSRLILVTSNLTLMKHILVKDFRNFVERSDTLRSNSPFTKSLFFAKQNEWKRHRQIVSPSFTTRKLKRIAQLIDKSAQNLSTYLEDCSKSGRLVPIKDIAAQYTGDIIARTAFGLNASFIGQKEQEFLHYARTMIRPLSGVKRVIYQLVDLIPNAINICKRIQPNLQFWDPISLEGTEYFKSTLRETIAEKMKQMEKGNLRRQVDFLDLLLMANNAAKYVGDGGVVDGGGGDGGSEKKPLEGVVSALSDEEVLGHSMLIIFAGMETTATTLHLSLYQLAQNSAIQERVFNEIQSTVHSTTPSPDELSSLQYLDQVINETLRLHPPVPLINRRAQETRTYDGITIPKGTTVIIPYFHIMADPSLYPHPETFNPDRFSPDELASRDLLSFVPFGQGPRQCLGMGLAYLELKMALVHVLRKLRVVINNETTVPKKGEELKFKSQALLTPVHPIMLVFELRE